MKIEQLEPKYQRIYTEFLEKLKETHNVVIITEPTFYLLSDGSAYVSDKDKPRNVPGLTQTIAEMKTRILLKRVVLRIEQNDIEQIIEDLVNEFVIISPENIIYMYDKGFEVLNTEQGQKIFIARFTTLWGNF